MCSNVTTHEGASSCPVHTDDCDSTRESSPSFVAHGTALCVHPTHIETLEIMDPQQTIRVGSGST